MWAIFFYSIGLYCITFFLILFYPIISNNTALNLHDCIHVDTWRQVRVLTESIILTWGLGDKYHPPSLNFPLVCIDFLKSQYSTVPDSSICSCPEDDVPWTLHPSALSQDDHWVGCPDLFYIFRRDTGLLYRWHLVRFPAIVRLSICK